MCLERLIIVLNNFASIRSKKSHLYLLLYALDSKLETQFSAINKKLLPLILLNSLPHVTLEKINEGQQFITVKILCLSRLKFEQIFRVKIFKILMQFIILE